MRIRTIKPEFWMHEGLCKQSDFTRLLAIALLNWADDEGYFMANPILIRGQVFPFLEDSKIIPRSLQDLSSVGWIDLGKDDQGREVGKIINFLKHQRVDKPQASKIKPFSAFQDRSKNVLGTIQDDSKEEWKGMEEDQGKGRDTPQPPKGAEVSLPSSESSTPTSTLSSEIKSEIKEKKEKGRKSNVSVHDLPADISASRRQSLATWLQHKAERGETYKTTGFTAIMARLAPLTDSQLAACVNDSICNNWAGLFPERLTSGQPFPSGKSRNGYPPPPPDEVKIIGADTSPPGWQQAWAELYTFPSPPHWLDVPPANQSEVIHYLRTRP